MRIFISICFNALILVIIAALVPYDPNYQAGVLVKPETLIAGAWKVYFLGGVILGVLNFFVRPILSFLGFPFMIVTFWLFVFVINWILLWLFTSIFWALNISGIAYEIHGWVDFFIAVAIFSVFNTLYNVFLKK